MSSRCQSYLKKCQHQQTKVGLDNTRTSDKCVRWSFCEYTAEPSILEYKILLKIFLKLRKTSDFGVLIIINNIFKTTQNLRFWSFCGGRKPPILEFLRIVRRTSDFGVLNIINNIFKTTQNLRFWSFCGGRKTSDFGVFAYSTQNLRFWSIKYY